MRNISLFVFILILCGCASPSQTIPSIYAALKPKVSDEIKEKMRESKSVYLELGVIPGAIYGSPLKEPRWYIDLNEGTDPALDITNFELELSKLAKPQDLSLPYNNLQVEPSNTKMVRISTFGIDAKSKKRLNGGLQDSSENYLILAYFDRACKVSGDLDFGTKGVFIHKIEIPHEGLYRLMISGTMKYKTVSATQSIEPIYVLLN